MKQGGGRKTQGWAEERSWNVTCPLRGHQSPQMVHVQSPSQAPPATSVGLPTSTRPPCPSAVVPPALHVFLAAFCPSPPALSSAPPGFSPHVSPMPVQHQRTVNGLVPRSVGRNRNSQICEADLATVSLDVNFKTCSKNCLKAYSDFAIQLLNQFANQYI